MCYFFKAFVCLLLISLFLHPSLQYAPVNEYGTEKSYMQSSHSESLADETFSETDMALVHNKKLNDDENYDSRREAVLFAIISACLVGCSGIVPLLILPSFKPNELKEPSNLCRLNRLLSFAVGGLLGDVFLHLLPESWNHHQKTAEGGETSPWASTINGLWVLTGLVSFCLFEKVFPDQNVETKDEVNKKTTDSEITELRFIEKNNNGTSQNFGNSVKPCFANGCISNENFAMKTVDSSRVKVSGYLNLLANCIDNFTHGLAVGGSFMVSTRVGMLTTIAILLHEIPHEVGDFAILLRAGFTRFQAVKLQLLTASGSVIGAITAFLAESPQTAGEQVSWILPFTSGGFIYVALCTIIPDMLQETSPKESLIQIFYLLLAILVMHGVSYIE